MLLCKFILMCWINFIWLFFNQIRNHPSRYKKICDVHGTSPGRTLDANQKRTSPVRRYQTFLERTKGTSRGRMFVRVSSDSDVLWTFYSDVPGTSDCTFGKRLIQTSRGRPIQTSGGRPLQTSCGGPEWMSAGRLLSSDSDQHIIAHRKWQP